MKSCEHRCSAVLIRILLTRAVKNLCCHVSSNRPRKISFNVPLILCVLSIGFVEIL